MNLKAAERGAAPFVVIEGKPVTSQFIWRALVLFALMPEASHAQTDPATILAGTSDGELRSLGHGWIQFRGPDELYFFLLDVVTTILLTGLIVYHPVRRKTRRSVGDLVMPRLFFLYGLIGMAVGFMVDQHGASIGFVIFGIGALLRFRSNLDDPVDTVEMIIVTVLGLAVGLGLPVMALLVALVSWGFIWLGGRNPGVEISVKGVSEQQSLQASENIETMARGAGWTLVRKHHVPGKLRVSLLYCTAGALTDAQIETMIFGVIPDDTELKVSL